MLIVNADDWGRSVEETDVALDFFRIGRVTSVTAMMFMKDSERAAELSRREKVPTGLHLNFSEAFTGPVRDERLFQLQKRIVRFLNSAGFAQLIYNPLLGSAFRAVYDAQLQEFRRLYGSEPSHFDGHQHMHLCANMLVALPIPQQRKVRRSFSFGPGEKSALNRGFRSWVASRLRRHYKVTEYFFALSQQLSEGRFEKACELGKSSDVEMMTHPIVPSERTFLGSDRCGAALQGVRKGSYLDLV